MNPFFFGAFSKQLFGIYHPPRSRELRDTSVVLCYPFGQEYMRSFKMFNRLADLLAKAGFHVLRFDYYGTGDSSGSSEEWHLAQSCEDVSMAVEELKSLSGNTRVSLVGLRLGAAIASSVASLNIEELVLWDPVVSGRDYVVSQKSMHQKMLTDPDRFSIHRQGEGENELLGFSFSEEACSEIEGLDLKEDFLAQAKRIFIVGSDAKDEYQALYDVLQNTGANVEYRVIDDAGNWDVLSELESALLLSKLLQDIVMMLSKGTK